MSPRVRFSALALGPLLLVLLGFVQAAPTYIKLKWTAPGDDSLIGRATRYDLRYAANAISGATFNSSRAATGLPTPQAPGGLETYTLSGLSPDSTYFIALRTQDNAGNWSAISNILVRESQILAAEQDSMPLAFSEPWPNPAHVSVRVSFTLPRGTVSLIRVYDLLARRIRTLDEGWRGPGALQITWNLRDEQGHRVAPGTYFIVARALGMRWSRRIVVID